MPVDRSLLPKIIAEAKKRHGEVIYSGRKAPPVVRIPFPSIEMNLATRGGAPLGRFIRFWGGPSSCKTLNAIGLAAEAQKLGYTVAFHDIEGTFDPWFAEHVLGLSLDEDKFTYVEGKIIEDLSRNLDALLHAVNIHIIDSTTTAISGHKADAAKESRQPGLDAIAWKDALRTAELNMDKRENMIILISHETQDFGTSAVKPNGARMIEFMSSMSIRHRAAKKLYRRSDGELSETYPKTGNDELTGSARVDGYFLELEVTKSKVCRPFGKANLIYEADKMRFDRAFELFKAGQFLGVIEQSGSYYKIPTSDKPIHGEAKMKERLHEDEKLVYAIFNAASKWIAEAQENRT